MKTEYYPVISPDEGFMLFNAKTAEWSDKVYVGRLASVDDWQERPAAEYEAWLAEEQARLEAEAEAAAAGEE